MKIAKMDFPVFNDTSKVANVPEYYTNVREINHGDLKRGIKLFRHHKEVQNRFQYCANDSDLSYKSLFRRKLDIIYIY